MRKKSQEYSTCKKKIRLLKSKEKAEPIPLSCMYLSLTEFQIKFKLEGAYKVKISMGLKITLSYLYTANPSL